MNRRQFLKTGGVLTAVAATGGSWYTYDHGVFSTARGEAFRAWEHWQAGNGQQTLPLVRAAILAASPHNTQPWRFELTDSSVALHMDRSRNVGNLDPYLREEYLGMGCALENLMLAAPACGYSASAILAYGSLTGRLPKQTLEPVARVVVQPGPREESDLYRAIPRRHTNRSPYDPVRPLPPDFLDALSQLPGADDPVKIFLFTESGQRENIAGVSSIANEVLYSDVDVEAASERWIRLQWKQVQVLRDGLTIDAFGLPPLTAAILKTLPMPILRPPRCKGTKVGLQGENVDRYALRAQINPHFLFNSLNTIADLVVTSPADAERMTLRLASVFRHVLRQSDRQLISLREEFEFLRNYALIEQERFGKRLSVNFMLAPEAADAVIPTLLLQPLLENSVKHGISPKQNGGRVDVRAHRVHDAIEIQIEDDGVGYHPGLSQTGSRFPGQEESSGVGLKNTEARLRTTYGDQASIQVDSASPAGCRVSIVIPANGGFACAV